MIKYVLSFLIICCFIISMGCSGGSETVGGSIEISNGYVAGTVLNSSVSAEEGALVKLIPVDFNPLVDSASRILIDTTDSLGFYEFKNLDSGSYNIILRDSSGLNALMVEKFKVYKDSRDTLVNSLELTGRIKVDVSTYFSSTDGYLYFKGTDIIVDVSFGSDSVIIANVPAGIYSKLISANNNLSDEKIVSSEILVVAEKDIELPYTFTVLMIDVDTTDMIDLLADIVSEMGGMPFIKRSSELDSTDTAGVDLVYISYLAELDENQIAFFKNVEIPIICSKAEYYQDLGFTVGVSNVFGYEENNRAIIDIDTHAITQGYFAADSSVEIYKDASSMPLMAWGSVWGSCTRIANGTLSQDHRVWFTFENGDEMNGLNAPANRAGIAITKGRALHESGIVLFKNTINWAINR